MNSREIDLLKLGFKINNDQRSYQLSKYGETWYVDFWKITDYDNSKWSIFMDDIRYDLREVKKQYYEDLREHPAYFLAAQENKKQILDELNKYRSWLQQETQFKVGKGNPNLMREIGLRSKIDILKRLIK